QTEAQKKPLEHYVIPKAFQQNSKEKLNLADETTKKVMCGINLSGYRHVLKPQCSKNTLGETIVDFYTLPNPVVADNAKAVVDHYYQHTRHNPLYQSKEFAKQMVETFGAFTNSEDNMEVGIDDNNKKAKTSKKLVIRDRKHSKSLKSGSQLPKIKNSRRSYL
ncbi:11941_t:CDS:2, partial [Gigaspora rosea]